MSTSKAVALTGKPAGFLKNEVITILLPPKLETVGKGVRMFGMKWQPPQMAGLTVDRGRDTSLPGAPRTDPDERSLDGMRRSIPDHGLR